MGDIYSLLNNTNIEYVDRMVHPIPEVPVMDRVRYILNICKGKRVLDIGGSGPMSQMLKEVATTTTVDRDNADICLNVEKDDLPQGKYDIIICGEILEHLSNA